MELPRDRTLIIHIETESGTLAEEAILDSVLTPSDPDAARRLISDPASALENF